jgi:uncharacterized protein
MAVMVRVLSGRMVDVERFEFSNFDPSDLAKSLSKVCRFNGHLKQFYSVAEHAVYVADLCHGAGVQAEFWGLLHDAAEAYIGDITRPVKRMIPGIEELELKILQVIGKAVGLPWPIPQCVWDADDRMLATEAVQLMNVSAEEFPIIRQVEQVNRELWCRGPHDAETVFMNRFISLQNRLAEANLAA